MYRFLLPEGQAGQSKADDALFYMLGWGGVTGWKSAVTLSPVILRIVMTTYSAVAHNRQAFSLFSSVGQTDCCITFSHTGSWALGTLRETNYESWGGGPQAAR